MWDAGLMHCGICATGPLSKPMLAYCPLDLSEQTSVKFEEEYNNFHRRKCLWKYCRQMAANLSGPQCDKVIGVFPVCVTACHSGLSYAITQQGITIPHRWSQGNELINSIFTLRVRPQILVSCYGMRSYFMFRPVRYGPVLGPIHSGHMT